jgi:hypothetical protein
MLRRRRPSVTRRGSGILPVGSPLETDVSFLSTNEGADRPFLRIIFENPPKGTDFKLFFKIALETRRATFTITKVPPYDDFGDWATPKEPAAELFLRFFSKHQINSVHLFI